MANDFAEEINFQDLDHLKVVGRGAFGVVYQARWRNTDVAVKLIETDAEKKAFITELKQLSRVCHPNIVQLYGACTSHPVCLVMEFAEGGSLYNVLHGSGPQLQYTAGHAMSWCLQCAKGVEYLHGMKPKPLVHRDLKPPNLLLINGGKTLKICDFGTACDAHTHMTNNKGSAAWMAPEVFEGSNYSEKCDVFSWGIILWEVLTRKKPFDEIGGPAFRIMWAVHNGTRPPLVKNCPKPIENLMTRCWSSNPTERPSMSQVVNIMVQLIQFFKGTDEPLLYPGTADGEVTPTNNATTAGDSIFDNPASQTSITPELRASTIKETVREALQSVGELVPLFVPTHQAEQPVVVEEQLPRQTSAPASLAASRENLLDGKSSRSSTPSSDMLVNKRYSADLTKLDEMDILAGGVRHNTTVKTHRRTGSHGNSPFSNHVLDDIPTNSNDTSSHHIPPFHHVATAPADLESQGAFSNDIQWTPGQPVNISVPWMRNDLNPERAAQTMAYLVMDHQLQPLTPCPTSKESMDIFTEHCKLAQKYLEVQKEIAGLTSRRDELQNELQQDATVMDPAQCRSEYEQLVNENHNLMLYYNNLKVQVEAIREQQAKRGGGTS